MKLLTFLVWTATAAACQPVNGPWITSEHLAAADPSWQSLPGKLRVAHSPDPGRQYRMSPAEQQLLAQRHHIDLTASPDLCFERQVRPLTQADFLQEIERLKKEQSWEFELLDFSPTPVPDGRLSFSTGPLRLAPSDGDASLMWRGRFEYDDGRSIAVWMRVKVCQEQEIPVAARDLAPTDTLAQADVEMVRQRAPALAAAPPPLSTFLGQSPRRPIRRGERLTPLLVIAPFDVNRGETVEVVVQDRRTTLRLQGVAQSSGRRGQNIVVRNETSGKLFRAVVEGNKTVKVICDPRSNRT